MDINEYQVTRPDGTVLLSALVPADQSYSFGTEYPGEEIRGPMVTRWRVCPDGKWTATAYYPDGWHSNPVPLPVASEPLL